MWDARSGKRVWETSLYKWPYRVLFSADSRTLLATSWEGFVFAWDAKTGQRLPWRETWHTGPVFDACFVAGRPEILVAGHSDDNDGPLLTLWSPTSRRDRALHGHTDGVHSVVASASGSFAASGGGDGTIHVWGGPRLQSLCVASLSDLANVGGYAGKAEWPTYAPFYRRVKNPAAVHAMAPATDKTLIVGTQGGAVLRLNLDHG